MCVIRFSSVLVVICWEGLELWLVVVWSGGAGPCAAVVFAVLTCNFDSIVLRIPKSKTEK